ncbi:MAG: sulfotransferase [Gammaproteobacteria bacterium]|nr:sulfotransferase [Gammaproteobacteria bacterium]
MNYQAPIDQLLTKVQVLANQGQIQSAYQLIQQIKNQHSKESKSWMVSAILSFQLGKIDASIKDIDKAIYLAPLSAQYKLQKLLLLESAGRLKEAVTYGKDLSSQQLDDVNILQSLAAFLNKHQLFKSSEKCYKTCLELTPNNPDLLLNLAMVKQYLGEVDQAEELASQALLIAPNNADILFFRSHLKKQNEIDNNIEHLKGVIDRINADPINRAKVYFSLGKELEDCKLYQESFAAREKGATIYRQSIRYDLQSEIDFLQAIRKNYTEEQFNSINIGKGYGNNEAIFVVGMPRTGTTLLERIISSHSDVTAAGELPHFSRCMSEAMQQLQLPAHLSRSQMAKASLDLNFGRLGKSYIDAGRAITGEKSFFVDKFPQNALYCGLIHKSLPKSKILILERHPVDVCYSVYKQMFTDIYQFSYDLDELADYFIEHQKLMQHWQKMLPNVVKTVRYEDLVQNLEGKAKEVIDFCGLDWQEDCLNFQNNKQVTTTASASQVRQKIYNSSVGMWKNYEKELEPLIKKIENSGLLEGW